MEGYAFIRCTHPESYYSRLENTKYVQNLLYAPTESKKVRKLSLISDDEIKALHQQIKVEVDQGIEVGDVVLIISGPYKNITGLVKEDIPEQDSVVIHIQLRSTDRLVTLPRAFLQLQTKPLNIAFRPNFVAIFSWATMALMLSQWKPLGLSHIYAKYKSYLWWDGWYQQRQRISRFFYAYNNPLDFSPIYNKFKSFQQLCNGIFLRDQIITVNKPLEVPSFSLAKDKYQKFKFLSDTQKRIISLFLELKEMSEPPVNLIVDGTQLYIRCAYVPGLRGLTDAQGRPTGAILGFLRSLGAYKKRFPKARIYVCWDGSSQRRKALSPEYKANRVPRENSGDHFEIDWLRDNLPLLDVTQAFNLHEEADDVIASLVKGSLRDNLNIIISTDRDFIQLVSEFTRLLCPPIAGLEKFYDPKLVMSEYGVQPASFPHVRALSGDTSDNIDGVPGFGLKTASKLINVYGTVTALLDSNLAGLSKGQAAKIRENNERILSNLELLMLKEIPFDQIKSDVNKKEAETKLKELGIKAEILNSFFTQE
jgi:5'-3' exonuclease